MIDALVLPAEKTMLHLPIIFKGPRDVHDVFHVRRRARAATRSFFTRELPADIAAGAPDPVA